MTAFVLAAALSVLPSDRLALADGFFNRGDYKAAEAEYRALSGVKDIAADELLFRLAECERATGRNDDARRDYSELAMKYPQSKHANRARFMYAMGATGKTRKQLLAALDSDRVDLETRTAALYHLGVETSDIAFFEQCVKLDPKGRYAEYANLRCGMALAGSALNIDRRRGIEILLGIGYGTGALADEALYLASIQSYRAKNYGEAGTLFRRYRKRFPKGAHAEECRVMSVWSDFLDGRFADAAAACGDLKGDDYAYLRAACAYSTGENDKAIKLFKAYLEEYPTGKYRADAELPLARLAFDSAQKQGDGALTIEMAKRGFGLSKLAADELRLAWAYEKAGKEAEARAEYTKLVTQFPKSDEAAEALYRRALMDVRAEAWPAVEIGLSEALASDKLQKFKGDALYWRGVAATKIGHEAEGVGFLKQALDLGLTLDQRREARLILADYDLREGRKDAAKDAYRQLIAEGACARMSAQRIHAVGKLLDGDAGRTCALELTKAKAAEWRQAGWTLLGDIEERQKSFTAAMNAYSHALQEKAKTEEAAFAALHLGLLEAQAGERDKAERTLKEAVALNTDAPKARARAYLALAQNAEARGDFETARAYATVVTSLFETEDVAKEAAKILAAHPEKSE